MKNGKIINEYGSSYYKDGELHRTNGPAFKGDDGTKFWFINGKFHREDGPAVEWYNGCKEWWLDSRGPYSEEEYIVELRKIKLQRIKELLKC